MTIPAAVVAMALGMAASLWAQREFDVVSVKPYAPSGPPYEGCNPRGDSGMLTRTGCNLQRLVEQAYGVKPYQVLVKGPAWGERG
jgi:uncharacterized protein (TIGR03435 family)